MSDLKFRDLRPEEIEVRVGATTKDQSGKIIAFGLLLYKTARVDANILDDTVGVFNWQKKFYQVKNTMVCSIGLWNEERHEWIWKDDGGDDDFTTEQVKAELSDSFKRAGFAIGIGRKLYTASKIYMRVDKDKFKSTEKDYFKVDEIEYDDTSITRLVISNKKTHEVVINYGGSKTKSTTPSPKTNDEEDLGEPLEEEDRKFLQEYVGKLGAEQYNNFFAWLEKQFGTRKIAELTKVQGKKAVGILKGRKK